MIYHKNPLRVSLFCNFICAKKVSENLLSPGSGTCGTDHYVLVSFIFQIQTVLLMCKHLKEKRDFTYCPDEQKGSRTSNEKRLNPTGPGFYKVPEWAALIRKNNELIGNNLYYCESLKYKYIIQKVRVTCVGIMIQSKIYFNSSSENKVEPYTPKTQKIVIYCIFRSADMLDDYLY